MIAMQCSECITTRARMHSGSVRKQKQFLRPGQICAPQINAAWENSSVVDVSWKTGLSSVIFMCFRLHRSGCFRTGLCVKRDLIFKRLNGKTRGRSIPICVLEDRTIFRDIHVLPTASKWVFQNRTLREKGSYFQAAEWENQGALDSETYRSEERRVFSRNLPRY